MLDELVQLESKLEVKQEVLVDMSLVKVSSRCCSDQEMLECIVELTVAEE